MGNVQAGTARLLQRRGRTPAAFKEHPLSAGKGAMRSAIPWIGSRKGSAESPDCWPAAEPGTSPWHRCPSLVTVRRGAGRLTILCPGRKAGMVAVFGIAWDCYSRRGARLIGLHNGLWIAPVRLLPGDERGLGHQIACGIFQCRDLGRRHLAANNHFEALRQYRGERMAAKPDRVTRTSRRLPTMPIPQRFRSHRSQPK